MKAIVDTIEDATWTLRGWEIKFILSDKLLHQVKLLSRVDQWYDDPVVADTYMAKMMICFNSIQQFYETFGLLPQVGDRLYNEESGVIIQDRSIDGGYKTLTFTLSV